MPTTGSGKFPYPNSSAVPDVPADVLLLAQRIDKMASGWTVAADATARAALVTNGDAYEGLHVYQIDTKVLYAYQSTAWVVAGARPGLTTAIPSGVAGTGVTYDSTTGVVTAGGTGTTISVDGVFNTRRTRIVADLTCASGTLTMVLRASATDVTSSNYDLQVLQGTTSTAAAAAAAAAASWGLNGGAAGTIHDIEIELSRAGQAAATSGREIAMVTQNPQTAPGIAIRGLSHRLSTAYTGFSIIGTQNLTGTVQVLDYY